MTIYVDGLVNNLWKLRGKIVKNCHMWSDQSTEELLDFAEKIGLKRSWVQTGSWLTHFDLVQKYRDKAIENGAIPLNRRDTVSLWRKMTAK